MSNLNLRNLRHPGDWPENFGAIPGNPAVDNSAALGAWLSYLIANNRMGEAAGSDYHMTTAVVRDYQAAKFGIVGKGSQQSRFVVNGNAGGIQLRSTARNGQATLEGFSAVANGTGGVGFECSQMEGGAAIWPSLIVNDVGSISGDWGGAETKYFGTGMRFAGHFDAKLSTVYAKGPGLFASSAPGSIRYSGAIGVDLQGCYDLRADNVDVQNFNIGVSSTVYTASIISAAAGGGTTRATISNGPHPFTTGFRISIRGASIGGYNGEYYVTNNGSGSFDLWADAARTVPVAFAGTFTATASIESGPEAMTFGECNINSCRKGFVYKRNNSPEPTLWVTESHFNCIETNIEVDGAFLVTIGENSFYNEARVLDWTGANAIIPRDIHLINAAEIVVTGNTYHSLNDVARQHPSRVHLDTYDNGIFTRSGDNGIFEDNICRAIGAANIANLRGGNRNWSLGPDTVSGTYTKDYEINNQWGNNNNVRQRDGLPITDLNLPKIGSYWARFEIGATNTPVASAAGIVEIVTWNDNNIIQTAHLIAPNVNTYSRRFASGVWSAWVQL